MSVDFGSGPKDIKKVKPPPVCSDFSMDPRSRVDDSVTLLEWEVHKGGRTIVGVQGLGAVRNNFSADFPERGKHTCPTNGTIWVHFYGEFLRERAK